MTNKRRNVLYVGCTVDLVKRVKQHKSHYYKNSFTDKYNCEYCVFYEKFSDYNSAIKRENRLKNMRRSEKIALINAQNPDWKEVVTEQGFQDTSLP